MHGKRRMFLDWDRVKVFVRPGATDLRKQINGLVILLFFGRFGRAIRLLASSLLEGPYCRL